MDKDIKFKVTSRSFKNGGVIPIKYTGFGDDISPDFQFTNLCENAVSIAIIMNDLDVPFTAEFNHWLIWNIPKMEQIPEDIPYTAVIPVLGNTVQGMAWGKNRYRGPKPPVFVRNTHRYVFRFFVLDCFLDLSSSAGKQQLMKSMEGHILQESDIMGTYKR